MEKATRSGVSKYFLEYPKGAVWLIILGVPLLFAFGLGIILIIIGLKWLSGWKKQPTDRQIDALIEDDLSKLRTQALDKTGLDLSELEADTVVLYGPRFWNTGGADIGIKKGKDDIIRFTPLGVTIINFTQNQLVAYQCALDLATGNALSESTDEYFYRDVVSVSTQSESVTWDKDILNVKEVKNGPLGAFLKGDKLQFNAAETFVLTTSGGTSLKVVLRDLKLMESLGGGEIPTDIADKAVQSVRRMLRDKKSDRRELGSDLV